MDSPPSAQGSVLSGQAELTSGDHHARVALSGTRASVCLQRAQMSGVTLVQYCRQGLMPLGHLADDEDLARLQVYHRVHADVFLAAVRLMDYHAVFLKDIRSTVSRCITVLSLCALYVYRDSYMCVGI